MKTIYLNNPIAKVLLYFSTCYTIMLFGFILSKRKELNAQEINHERIHVAQFRECFVVGLVIAAVLACFGVYWGFVLPVILFYLLYGAEWLVSIIHHFFASAKKSAVGANKEAYRNSAMEMEAYDRENDLTYLAHRQPLGFLNYYGKL